MVLNYQTCSLFYTNRLGTCPVFHSFYIYSFVGFKKDLNHVGKSDKMIPDRCHTSFIVHLPELNYINKGKRYICFSGLVHFSTRRKKRCFCTWILSQYVLIHFPIHYRGLSTCHIFPPWLYKYKRPVAVLVCSPCPLVTPEAAPHAHRQVTLGFSACHMVNTK